MISIIIFGSHPLLKFVIDMSIGTSLPKKGKKASILQLFRVPEILISALVVIASGSLFGFLNPTLEPAISSEVVILSIKNDSAVCVCVCVRIACIIVA